MLSRLRNADARAFSVCFGGAIFSAQLTLGGSSDIINYYEIMNKTPSAISVRRVIGTTGGTEIGFI